MVTKLKRSVFIGLGGSRVNSILETKKLYQDAFGEIPESVGFLGIDTNPDSLAQTILTADSKRLNLEANERVLLTMFNSSKNYFEHKERFNWVHYNNVQAFPRLSSNGAQVRTNGRFSFTINYSKVENGIRNVVDRVSNAVNNGKGKWELADDREVFAALHIYLVFSLGGGTGCGAFLSTAFLINDLWGDNFDVQACAIIPSISEGGGQYMGANAYGALLDTDYLMTYTAPGNPFNYALLDGERSTSSKPFDIVYLVDNKNGDKDTEPYQLYSLISHMLFANSTSIGFMIDANRNAWEKCYKCSLFGHAKNYVGGARRHGPGASEFARFLSTQKNSNKDIISRQGSGLYPI